ncbi:B3/B4 domain-containing protein [Mesorhizobium humile]|uniref:Phenylalanine--tRNA ligase beta subunit-related protein n=1 Tax=Mesorhizobium humile TaxID=3072313 RepID=A0ABU4YF97_9HYPH|nr:MULTISPECIES: phenylalanine--tRNA ligase beta subunit-related protein [unclassified Mesorhizobium]MDX8457586.1 phenylalanine--tRNA ligase beta subunit-related protein [Mesorhizobium sp. VK2D]MDX8485605.1 phenylalanine--tRNA ligase beta subunit-related protein [Mesorhizobium sp. VK2B]
MQFCYAPDIRTAFPQLQSRVLLVDGIDAKADPSAQIARLNAIADRRLAATSEGEFPEIQAWRRAFSAMGLKPTNYRCASEALLRRYRKERALPALHPLIDLCNAASLAFAIPVAVFDTARVTGAITVRPAYGTEIYETFAGDVEHPERGEVIFADDTNRAHARRWTHRQSGWSAIRPDTTQALIVVEALHKTAGDDLAVLTSSLTEALAANWPAAAVTELEPL